MLNVWIDCSTIVFDNLTGIGRYIVEISKNLQMLPEIELKGACKLSRWHRKQKIQKHLPNLPLRSFPSLGRQPDLFHGPDYFIKYCGKAKKVVTIHDLATFHPNLVESKRIETSQEGNIQKIIQNKNLDAIITISEFVKKEILHFFPQIDKPIFVTPLVANHKSFDYQKTSPQPYLLYVGVWDKRKNVLGLCKAFEKIADKYPDFLLVLAGSQNGFEAEKVAEHIAQSKFRERFRCYDYVSESKLQDLYAKAWAFVFPSFYEGFGIPVLEAMHYGLPVLTSLNSAMQEVAQDAALYINPHEIDSIAEGIEKIIADNPLRQNLVAKANQRLQFFSWEYTAQKTYEVYQSML
jgi:glycosyltransferase involved in cell wall biosynthesis